MKNFQINFHGEFSPPLVVASAAFGADGVGNSDETVVLNGFYAARQIQSKSRGRAIDEWAARINEDIELQFSVLRSGSNLALDVDDVEELDEDFLLPNEGYTFY